MVASSNSRSKKLFAKDESAKFHLFLKTREVQHLAQALRKVTILPHHQREDWLEENGDFLAEEFDEYINNAGMTFEGLTIDEETLELSRDLVFSLREALTTVEGMLHTSGELES